MSRFVCLLDGEGPALPWGAPIASKRCSAALGRARTRAAANPPAQTGRRARALRSLFRNPWRLGPATTSAADQASSETMAIP